MATIGSYRFGSAPFGAGVSAPLVGTTTGIYLTIAGTDYSGNYRIGSLRIQDQLNSRNTASFSLVDLSQLVDIDVGEEVHIYINGVKVFSGSVNETRKETPIAGGVNFISIRCVDHNAILDRFTLFKIYDTEGQTLQDVVEDIINVQTVIGDKENISTIGVAIGPALGKIVYNGQTVREAFDELSRATGYAWYVDYGRDLKFFDRATYYAPFDLSDANAIYRSMSITKTRESYRNIQFLRGGTTTTDERTETFKANGEETTFTLEYEINNDPATNKPVIKVDTPVYAERTIDPANIGIRGVDPEEDEDGNPTNFEWFYTVGEKEISFSNKFDLADPEFGLPDGTKITVTYIGQFAFIDQAVSETRIAERKAVEGYSGIYEHLEKDDSVNDIRIADYRVEQLLKEFGKIREEMTFEVDSAGLRSGQLIQLQSNELGIDDQYLIDQITLTDVQGFRWRYQGKALNGRHVDRWPEFFQKLFEAGKKITIRENELLIVFREVNETYTISDSLAYVTSAITTTFDEDPYTVALIGYSTGSNIMGWPARRGLIGKHPTLP